MQDEKRTNTPPQTGQPGIPQCSSLRKDTYSRAPDLKRVSWIVRANPARRRGSTLPLFTFPSQKRPQTIGTGGRLLPQPLLNLVHLPINLNQACWPLTDCKLCRNEDQTSLQDHFRHYCHYVILLVTALSPCMP